MSVTSSLPWHPLSSSFTILGPMQSALPSISPSACKMSSSANSCLSSHLSSICALGLLSMTAVAIAPCMPMSPVAGTVVLTQLAPGLYRVKASVMMSAWSIVMLRNLSVARIAHTPFGHLRHDRISSRVGSSPRSASFTSFL